LADEPVGVRDFYARYHALRTLGGMLAASPGAVATAVAGAPLGVARLAALLAPGGQEVLRNEALLLLARLADASADVRSAAVFEGMLDTLFGIVG
jgi:hypothetical protein